MPLVLMKPHLSARFDPRNFRDVMQSMPKIVAEALSAPEDNGALIPKEIEVWEMPTANKFYGDIGHHDLQIVIYAHDYPSRLANLDNRRQQIIDNIKPLLQEGVTFFVWVLCMPTSWAESVGEAKVNA